MHGNSTLNDINFKY